MQGCVLTVEAICTVIVCDCGAEVTCKVYTRWDYGVWGGKSVCAVSVEVTVTGYMVDDSVQ